MLYRSILTALVLFGGAGTVTAQQVVDNDLFPPNAKAGECYTRTFAPPAFREVTEQVLVREASANTRVIPARYETVEQRVLVREAVTRLEVVPAEFDWVEERIMVKPERTDVVEVSPVYDTVTEQVVDTPAHTVWKPGRGPIEVVDNSTGEIMCLVDVPATYKSVQKRVLRTPGTTREVTQPAEYTTVRKRVVKTPATVREVEDPAVYETILVMKKVSEATVAQIEVPAEYNTYTRNEIVTGGGMEWRQVLCETNTTPDIIRGVQRALRSAGYDPGSIDGVLGRSTMVAVRRFQQRRGLASGGLTIETVRALGL